MSAPTRGQRGGLSTRSRAGSNTPFRGGSTNRASSNPPVARRGRGGATASSTARAAVLQSVQSNLNQKTSERDSATRNGGGMGPSTRGRNTSRGHRNLSATSDGNSRSNSPAPSTQGETTNTMMNKFLSTPDVHIQIQLKQKRDAERAAAIRDGFLADPEKKTSLDQAITPVGTCSDMCPEFERIERIVQNMVDKTEKTVDEVTGRAAASEAYMVKRFKRSAAGDDEQLPSDIRTSTTLRKTLDYLFDEVVGSGERLSTVHKFVWDRTRSIRNDFSIQQVSKVDDVKIAVECFERIARFHILSLHQLSNPENLDGEHFDAHQDREQLNNTMLSLMYYYDDYRDRIHFPNESEFRAYLILFELHALQPDLEDRLQSWAPEMLSDRRVKTAYSLYAAASNTVFDQGPLRPMTPFPIAQANGGSFWTLLRSKAVSYLMACVAELYFPQVRFVALDNLWKSVKSASAGQQSKNREWTLDELTGFLSFDAEEETKEFCEIFSLNFRETESGETYLDITTPIGSLDKSLIATKQTFSHMVEEKRFRRTLPAVVNGVSAGQAISDGIVEPEAFENEAEEEPELDADTEDNSLFFPEEDSASTKIDALQSDGKTLNPTANLFQPKANSIDTPKSSSIFGAPALTPGLAFPRLSSTSSQDSVFGPSSITSKPSAVTAAPLPSALPQPSSTTSPWSLQSFDTASDQRLSSFDRTLSTKLTSTPASGATPTTSTVSFTPAFLRETPTFQIAETQKPGTIFTGQGFQPQQMHTIFGAPLSTAGLPSTLSASESMFRQPLPRQPAPPETRTSTLFGPPNTSWSTSDQPVFSFTPFSTAAQSQPQQHNEGPKVFDIHDNRSLAEAGKAEAHLDQAAAAFTHAPNLFPEFPPQSASSLSPAFPPNIGAQSSATNIATMPLSPRSTPATISPLKQQLALGPQSFAEPDHKASPPTPGQMIVTEADRINATESVYRLSLLQQDGLLQQYLECYLPEMLKTIYSRWVTESRESARRRERADYLHRKYLARWKDVVKRNLLLRKSQIRRERYSQYNQWLQEENERRFKMEREREEIMAAIREKEEIQAQQRQERERQRQEQVKKEQAERLSRRRARQVAMEEETRKIEESRASKRKSLGEAVEGDDATPRKFQRTLLHRRTQSSASRFFDRSTGPMTPLLATSPRSYLRNAFNGEPHNGHYYGLGATKAVDRTHTDYFRLKALGVDPETPVHPHTETSLTAAKNREMEKKRSAAMPSRLRRGAASASWENQKADADAEAKRAKEAAGKAIHVTNSMQPQSTRSSTSDPQSPHPPDPDIAKIAREMEEFNKKLIESTEWMKSERCKLEEAEQEESRRSQDSQKGLQTDASGLVNVNGYKVRPLPSTSGKPLSRLEQRIMQSGAGGFATAPIPGTPEYQARASSRSSLATSTHDPDQESSGTSIQENPHSANGAISFNKRKSPEFSSALSTTQNFSKRLRTTMEDHSDQPEAKEVSEPVFPSINGYSQGRHSALETEDDELLEDEDADAQEQEGDQTEDEFLESGLDEGFVDGDQHHSRRGFYGHEDADEESLEEESYDEDDEVGNEVEDLHALAEHAYLNIPKSTPAATGGIAMSRGTSGTGASVEEALLLDSDSD